MAEVFWFKVKDPATGRARTYPKKGTEQAIKRLGGDKVWGSVEEVDDAKLDADGFYTPPKGRFADLSPRNRDLVARLAPHAEDGTDWDEVGLTGVELDRVLDAAREEGRLEAQGGAEGGLAGAP